MNTGFYNVTFTGMSTGAREDMAVGIHWYGRSLVSLQETEIVEANHTRRLHTLFSQASRWRKRGSWIGWLVGFPRRKLDAVGWLLIEIKSAI